MPSIEPFNLVHAGPSVLGERVDVHLPFAEREPHTDRRVPKRIERVAVFKDGVLLQLTGFQQFIELPLGDPLGAGTVPIAWEEEVVVGS